ncbi:MAG: hypothetical protein ACYC3X_24010 [Pirellulaceae bacterium]
MDISGQPNNNDWQKASTVILTGLEYGEQYELYFQVRNNYLWLKTTINTPAAHLPEPMSALV